MALEDNTIAIGEIINDHYKLIRCIALGIDRMIFCAIDTQFKLVAIKFEKDAQYQTSVCIESAILKILANQIHIPQFFLYGQHKNYKFLAEEFLGPNMIDLVNYKKPNKFSLHSILKFGIQAIEALQVVHSKGFVHRDIKPGNFLIGNSQETSGTFYLTDFGTYKKIYERNGVITKPTNKANFRGSLLYASLNAHNSVELGRNDDLMSLLYIMVEFYNGGLPWSDKDDIQKIEASKFIYHGLKLLKRLPKQFIEFELYIISLDYTTVPDYQYLTFLLKQAAEENEIDLNDPFEWELEMDNEREHIMKHQSKVQQKIHTKLQQLENEKHQIKAQNQKDFEEKFFQLNQEISEQKQQILSPNQQTPSALVSYSPLHTPFHSNFDMTSLIDQKSQQDSQSNMQQSTQRSKNDHKEGISTVQELLTLLDALVGLDPNTTNDNNNTQDQSSQQQTKNNFIEQFMNEMNKKEEKVNDNNWAQFVNSNTESKENELIETFDLTNQDETTNVIMRFRNDEEQDLQEQQEKQTRQTKNNLEIEIESNLYSPPLLEFQQQNSPLYSPQTLSPTNSSLFHTPIEGSPKTNSNVIYQPSTIPKERQINPQLLEQEVHPINEVIRNEVGQTRAYKTLIANMKITKQPQALIFSSQVELETIPKTPICAELSQELIQWSLTDGSKQDMMRYNRDHSEENSQFSYDKENNNDGDQDSCNDIEFQDSDNQLDKKNKRKSSKFNRSQAKKSLKRSSLSLQYQDQDYDGDEDEDEDEYTQNEDQDRSKNQ
ncbi:MAG: putative Tau-tubulin kinase 2 [Streblomastix strix]|uniref:non-specific serine/threonine protein kinase n=1 Tax=Streblomastix strix TaxID=222440 RepID=A0A5J4X1Y6_9EUKA|nr:MAG: putative Tau-tubulin kinase 2 [Streblomastix strix]